MFNDVDRSAIYFLYSIEYFSNAVAMTVTAVKTCRLAAFTQIVECMQVSRGEISYVDVVAYTSAVCSWVVSAVNVNFRSCTDRYFCGNFN